MKSFKQLIIIANPKSTHGEQAAKRGAILQALFRGTPIKEIDLKPGVPLADQLIKCTDLLGPQTLLAIGGGDGTVNGVLHFLLTADLKAAQRKTVILPLWGGNANDLANMLNGPSYLSRTEALLEKGEVIAVRPLYCEIEDENGDKRLYVAAGYLSFGAIAAAARRLNTFLHRQSFWHKIPGARFIREVYTVGRTMAESPTFHIIEQGRRRTIYEWVFINGSRMAKIRPLKVKLTDEAYHELKIERKHLPQLLLKMLVLLRPPHFDSSPEGAAFVCEQAVWAQYDGEAFKLKPGSKIRVYRSGQPFYAWSTRLR